MLRSEKEEVKPGNHLYVGEMRAYKSMHRSFSLPWCQVTKFKIDHQHYNVLSPDHPVMVINNERKLPLSLYLGVLGMPGTYKSSKTCIHSNIARRENSLLRLNDDWSAPKGRDNICIDGCRTSRSVS